LQRAIVLAGSFESSPRLAMTVLILLESFLALRSADPTAVLLICREPFDQNGSDKFNCAIEKRRLSAAFEAKSGKALLAKCCFSAT
jgi:hypothetical protein